MGEERERGRRQLELIHYVRSDEPMLEEDEVVSSPSWTRKTAQHVGTVEMFDFWSLFSSVSAMSTKDPLMPDQYTAATSSS